MSGEIRVDEGHVCERWREKLCEFVWVWEGGVSLEPLEAITEQELEKALKWLKMERQHGHLAMLPSFWQGKSTGVVEGVPEYHASWELSSHQWCDVTVWLSHCWEVREMNYSVESIEN